MEELTKGTIAKYTNGSKCHILDVKGDIVICEDLLSGPFFTNIRCIMNNINNGFAKVSCIRKPEGYYIQNGCLMKDGKSGMDDFNLQYHADITFTEIIGIVGEILILKGTEPGEESIGIYAYNPFIKDFSCCALQLDEEMMICNTDNGIIIIGYPQNDYATPIVLYFRGYVRSVGGMRLKRCLTSLSFVSDGTSLTVKEFANGYAVCGTSGEETYCMLYDTSINYNKYVRHFHGPILAMEQYCSGEKSVFTIVTENAFYYFTNDYRIHLDLESLEPDICSQLADYPYAIKFSKDIAKEGVAKYVFTMMNDKCQRKTLTYIYDENSEKDIKITTSFE